MLSVRNASTFLIVAALVVLGSWIRIDTALSLPEFDAVQSEGMLRSDPGMLHYLTQRVIEAGGGVPSDFRADPRIEHPLESDLPAMFTVGQEFLVGWLYLLSGTSLPLHTFALIVMGIVASLVVVGVFGLAWELTGSRGLGVFAASLAALLPANYRSLSFIFMREDLSLPLFAVHLWLLARAARLRTPLSFAFAGLSLVLALATWHAMGMVVFLEAACFFGWFLRTGRSPLALPGTWALVAVVAAGAVLVPVLAAKLYLLSPAMQIGAALMIVAAYERRTDSSTLVRVAVGVGAWVGCAVLFTALGQALIPGAGDYAHVYEVMAAKLRFLGERPEDPTLLSFGARIMWQGPFVTGSPSVLLDKMLVPLLLLPFAVPQAFRVVWQGKGESRIALLIVFGVLFAFSSMAVWRMRVVLGLLVPVISAILLRRFRPSVSAGVAVALLALQAWSFQAYLRDFSSGWYNPPAQAALADTLYWIRANLPDDGAIASDVLNSTAILAHTRHSIVLQPKYETARSRQRLEAFMDGLYHKRPGEFSDLLADHFQARYLVVDLPRLRGARYIAGLPAHIKKEPAKSAARSLLHRSPGVYRRVPGFTLLHESTPKRIRIYRVD